MKNGTQTSIIIEIPVKKTAYGVKVDGVAVVTATREDGCYRLHIPSQFVNIDNHGHVVEEWPKYVHKGEVGEVRETFVLFPEALVVDKPLKDHGK